MASRVPNAGSPPRGGRGKTMDVPLCDLRGGRPCPAFPTPCRRQWLQIVLCRTRPPQLLRFVVLRPHAGTVSGMFAETCTGGGNRPDFPAGNEGGRSRAIDRGQTESLPLCLSRGSQTPAHQICAAMAYAPELPGQTFTSVLPPAYYPECRGAAVRPDKSPLTRRAGRRRGERQGTPACSG